MSLHVERIEEMMRKLAAENESIQVTQRQINALLTNRSRPKRPRKATKMIT